jgi:hypothetical protein
MMTADGRPAENPDPERIGELAHLGLLIGEAHQRPDGEAELHAEHDLAGDQQLRRLAFAENADDPDGGDDGQRPGHQPAQPGASAGH